MRKSLSASIIVCLGLISASSFAYTTKSAADGSVVKWHTGSVDVIVDPSLNEITPEASEIVERAAYAWLAVEGARPPIVHVVAGDADAIGYTANAANHCTVRYAPEGWPEAGDALAVTVLTSSPTGAILDADIVVNGGPARPFAQLDGASNTQTAATAYDLENVLTHEFGHFFGFGEEPKLADDTMFPYSARGETKKRGLAADDEAGLVALYPKNGADSFTSACSFAPAPRDASASLAGVAALVAAGLVLRRRASTNVRIIEE